MVLYGKITIEKEWFPIFAGMQFGTKNIKLIKVGKKLIEFTYDVNPNNANDKLLIGSKEISRKFFNN